ncbi:MAG: MFS transporter [Jatrophihabitans sp.]
MLAADTSIVRYCSVPSRPNDCVSPRTYGVEVDRDFRRLWAAVGTSSFGSALSAVALPLIALFSVHASAVELGALIGVEQVAWLAFGLLAGVWVDRWPRKRVMVLADIGRAVLVGLLPVAAWTGVLQLWMLFAAGLLIGVCNVFDGVAHTAVLPQLVDSSDLIDANSRINVTDTASSLSGSAVVGPIVAFLGAPIALAIDAMTFAASATLVSPIDVPPVESPPRTNFRHELIDGIRIVVRDSLFRTLTLGSAAFNACTAAQYVLGFLFLRELGVPKAWYGVLLAAGGVGGLLGSALLPRLTRRHGDASLWRVALVAGPTVGLLVPLAQPGIGIVPFAVGTFGLGAAVAMTSVIGFSARQALCPPEILGRVAATTRVLTWGVIPIAAVAGGWLASGVGVRNALWIVAACFFAEPLIIRCTRVWRWAGVQASAQTS